MGGLLDIVFAIGTLLTVVPVSRAFHRSLLSDAYQVQGRAVDRSEYYYSKTARACLDKDAEEEEVNSDFCSHQQAKSSLEKKHYITDDEEEAAALPEVARL